MTGKGGKKRRDATAEINYLDMTLRYMGWKNRQQLVSFSKIFEILYSKRNELTKFQRSKIQTIRQSLILKLEVEDTKTSNPTFKSQAKAKSWTNAHRFITIVQQWKGKTKDCT